MSSDEKMNEKAMEGQASKEPGSSVDSTAPAPGFREPGFSLWKVLLLSIIWNLLVFGLMTISFPVVTFLGLSDGIPYHFATFLFCISLLLVCAMIADEMDEKNPLPALFSASVRTFLGPVLLVVVLVVIGMGHALSIEQFGMQPFEKNRFLKFLKTGQGWRMVKDLAETRYLIGKNRAEVLDLLGPPTKESASPTMILKFQFPQPMNWPYSNPSPLFLDLTISSGTVIEACQFMEFHLSG